MATTHRPLRRRDTLRWRLAAAFGGLAILTAALVGAVLLPMLAGQLTRFDETYGTALAERAAKELASVDWSSRDTLAAEATRIAAATQAHVRLLDRSGAVAAQADAPAPADIDPEELYLPGLVSPAEVQGTVGHAFSVDVMPRSGPALGSVELVDVPAHGTSALLAVARAWLLASLLAVLVAGLVGLLVARRLGRPLAVLGLATERMGGGDLAARTGLAGEDEVGRVAASFDVMAGQVEGTVATLRRFVADAAHELGTPMTALQADLDLAVEAPDAEARDRHLARAQEQLERLDTLRRGLLALSRLEGPARPETASETANLADVVREIVGSMASRADQLDIGLVADLGGDQAGLVVPCERARLAGVVANLVDNALKFTPAGGRVTVTLAAQAGAPGWVRLVVEDTGVGIDATELPLVFERFHRARSTQAIPGSGLGLAIVRATVERAGGEVAIDSEVGRGTRVTVVLPRATAMGQVTNL